MSFVNSFYTKLVNALLTGAMLFTSVAADFSYASRVSVPDSALDIPFELGQVVD